MLNANNSSMNGTLIPQHMLNDISVNLRIRQEYFQQKISRKRHLYQGAVMSRSCR